MGPLDSNITDIIEADIPENSRLTLGKLEEQEFPMVTPAGGSAWLL